MITDAELLQSLHSMASLTLSRPFLSRRSQISSFR